MPGCEKCWHDAHVIADAIGGSVADEYARLINQRREAPCTPEEQCGEMHLLLDWMDRPRQCLCGKRVEDVDDWGDKVTARSKS